MTRREFAAGLTAASLYAQELPANRLVLWYKRPRTKWTDALPVGNGRFGAMVFGGIAAERLQLNEDTLWSGGGPREWNNPEAKKHLAEVRALVLEKEDYAAADRVCKQMQGPYNQSYQPLGDLRLTFDHPGEATEYRRELDLDTAVSRVTYRIGAAEYVREAFVSGAGPGHRRAIHYYRAGGHGVDRGDRQPRAIHVPKQRQYAAADRKGARACRAELCAIGQSRRLRSGRRQRHALRSPHPCDHRGRRRSRGWQPAAHRGSPGRHTPDRREDRLPRIRPRPHGQRGEHRRILPYADCRSGAERVMRRCAARTSPTIRSCSVAWRWNCRKPVRQPRYGRAPCGFRRSSPIPTSSHYISSTDAIC